MLFVILAAATAAAAMEIRTPVRCSGPVPKISEGKYIYYDDNEKNETYKLRFTTTVELKLDLHHRSCFQVDIESDSANGGSIDNATTNTVKALFYAVTYDQFVHYYPVRASYQFGIPEFQSFCKCDCPKADAFCGHNFGQKACSKGEICVTKYHESQQSLGCQDEGPATMCCEISVRPYGGRRFTAISLATPTSEVDISIEIFALFDDTWSLFRRYRRKISPYKSNTLHLNGYENVADIYAFANADYTPHQLTTGTDKYYYYEDNVDFDLIDSPDMNHLYSFNVDKLGWLRFEDGRWFVYDPMVSLAEIHRPQVTNCKEQAYVDRYNVPFRGIVIRNSTGATNAVPVMGHSVTEEKFINSLSIFGAGNQRTNEMSLTLNYNTLGAPSVYVKMQLQQKLTVIAHVHASTLESFTAEICLDKHSNRYLNVTLIYASGEFGVEVYKDALGAEVELVFSVVTKLPFASNYTDILPLPAFVTSTRLVCLYPAKKISGKLCVWATYRREPVDWYALQKPFIETAGNCPGCNVDAAPSNTFWSNLDPRKWFNGIGSISEGFAMAVEIVFYALLVIVSIVVWRRFLWPLIRWSLCSKQTAGQKICVAKSALV